MIEGEARKPADQQRARIDEMGRKVENFTILDHIQRHDILDVLVMSTRADFDENNAEDDEGDEQNLSRGRELASATGWRSK